MERQHCDFPSNWFTHEHILSKISSMLFPFKSYIQSEMIWVFWISYDFPHSSFLPLWFTMSIRAFCLWIYIFWKSSWDWENDMNCCLFDYIKCMLNANHILVFRLLFEVSLCVSICIFGGWTKIPQNKYF